MTFTHTDLFSGNHQVVVNPVNCVGTMGKGLAKRFAILVPEMLPTYRQACRIKALRPGGLLNWGIEQPSRLKFRVVINAATKDHWQDPSRMEWVETCLQNIAVYIQGINPAWITAIPALGCGLGGLDADDFLAAAQKYLAAVQDRVVLLKPR